ncbi:DUF6694 family lipoprotein [Shewanella fodinae]|uniref:DUF6694 family lipoprotein n=1 Tax=Shewanella fodinae TaxID=552357 RepID=UPI00167193A0|nr:DUF6694 family lipoprotein [Shewanella fodinae]MCL2907548.1 hypothetical protein [Shewanella fodinae]GGZ09824.1 hypothetical protein GCM10007169_28060 [Shewanella fodinae]
MKAFISMIVLPALLLGCFGSPKFDATNETTIKESVAKIAESLPDTDKAEFTKAVMYFSIGGSDGFKAMMGAAFTGKNTAEAMLNVNIKEIDGLTGKEILQKYRTQLEAEKARQQKIEAEQSAIQQLKTEAEQLLSAKSFKEALAKYDAISKYDSGVNIAIDGIEKTNQEMKHVVDILEYQDKIQLTEFTATRIDTYKNKAVPAVRIGLKNTGEKSLDKVQVTVYFQDHNGKTIFEKDYLPVLVNKYTTDKKPLKAGYVYEMEKGTYYTLDSPLTEWETGKAQLKITDLQFSN